MAGILLLAWPIVESLDHNAPFGPLQRASDPMTESPIARDESAMSEEEKRSSNALYIGPPQLSLELQATEPGNASRGSLSGSSRNAIDTLALQFTWSF